MRRLAVTAGFLALALVAVGCGSNNRDAVNAYFKRVDAVQRELAPRIKAANRAYTAFGKAGKSATERAALERSEATVRELRRRLAAIEPPKEARRLHRLLLDLADREVAFSGEVLALARYTPAFQRIVLHAGLAGRKLQRTLRKTAAAAAGPAFRDYAAALEVDVRRLRPSAHPRRSGRRIGRRWTR